VFRVNSFLPIEIIAKVPLNEQSFKELMMEDHIVKLVAHPDYVCEIKEEIILFDTKNNKV
jgi:hypothetical protein